MREQVEETIRIYQRTYERASIKVDKYKHPRFIKAREYWRGVRDNSAGVVFQLKGMLEKEQPKHDHPL